MILGELFLEALASGVITPSELSWVTARQSTFSRVEEATALRLGRLLDDGTIQLGCRLPQFKLHHDSIREDWIEPLGRRRGRSTLEDAAVLSLA
ncbi:hypothetical protein VB716_03080 [Synechococcus sp. CCY9201]|uniref:hypothetical protein n=1 Tax=unclassified Synechococcus TaxID=2626047 RepID=UPI0018CDD7B0|nr:MULTISPECIES: hypothetical protein [unclassified Synechococcus]MEA5423338.1 hypothetical protein [Synechococcus sp. CCY9202]MEA5473200.1 hypothetical protein [Synechococcus sp. CCY9201]QPN60532.1 hypothetical protein H8F24_03600 [Synechococcus sp. CBW1002]QPN67758.1 hypothetical protein H8F26_06355 [Synechococcus sp. CBW1006]CAK6688566.1 hypothetical protein IFHNHDMJ_00433 [Synechococcus sp. CBW1107]